MADAVTITGLRETVRALERYGADVADLKGVMQRVGELVAVEIRHLAPHRSGRLARSVRPSKAKSKAIVRAGSARVDYAAVQNYGWPGHNIEPKHFMERGLESKQADALRELADGLNEIAARHGLT